MSRPAQIKDQLELDDEEGRRRDDWSGLRTASGRATPITDSPCCLRHEHQLVLRVGGSNHQYPVKKTLVCTLCTTHPVCTQLPGYITANTLSPAIYTVRISASALHLYG